MNMQQMPMEPHGKMLEMHNTFWRDDQVAIVFRSDTPLVIDGIISREPFHQLDLRAQPQKLNAFLQDKKIAATLEFLGSGDQSSSDQPSPVKDSAPRSILADELGLPPGTYPFGFSTPMETPFGSIQTSVISFFQVKPLSSSGGSRSMSMSMHGSGDDDDGGGDNHSKGDLIPQIIKLFNENLEELNKARQIPVTIVTPNWLSGGTGGDGGTSQGCPLTPPVPVADNCSNWHFELPDLPSNLQSMTGDGVTVFILDAFPERGVITRAARDAGDDNQLLSWVNENATFDYRYMSGVENVQEMAASSGAYVGKDVYGRHYPVLLADHGLFIAGIVHDVAPGARIECVRVLDDLCVGDVRLLANVLSDIYLRNALRSQDLFDKPVVVNLSLVIPTDAEAHSKGVNTKIGGVNNVWSTLKHPLQCLSEQGAMIAASAGNEGDLREMPTGGDRPNALYPARFVYEPYNVGGIIPVGAVSISGGPASYSCYPGELGIATYGGEVPGVTPKEPPSSGPALTYPLDAPCGIYSSVEYPPLSADPPEQYYTTPNDHAWAYWLGTSFATPIVSAVAARVLESKTLGFLTGGTKTAIYDAASDDTQWDRVAGAGGNLVPGRMIRAKQSCNMSDSDKDDVLSA